MYCTYYYCFQFLFYGACSLGVLYVHKNDTMTAWQLMLRMRELAYEFTKYR